MELKSRSPICVLVLPARLLEALDPAARVVEVGVGGRFDVLETLLERRPDLDLVATDVHEAALEGAPAGVATHVDDVVSPRVGIYEGAGLLYAVRCPAELQVPLARLADRVGARLAIRALKDEWADVDRVLGPHELASPEGVAWRIWPPVT